MRSADGGGRRPKGQQDCRSRPTSRWESLSRYERRSDDRPGPTKTWIKRAAPIVLAHKVQFFAALIFSFLGLIIQVWIPLILQNGITDALITEHAVRCTPTSS